MDNYHCKDCGLLVKNDEQPKVRCDKSGSGNHHWEKM